MALLLLILWPIAEIYVAILVAEAIGVLPMLLLLIVSWPLGLLALRSQGRVAWRRLGDAVAAGRSPGREVLNGALVVLGGMLMLVPGFITDVLGALLLLPPPARAPARCWHATCIAAWSSERPHSVGSVPTTWIRARPTSTSPSCTRERSVLARLRHRRRMGVDAAGR